MSEQNTVPTQAPETAAPAAPNKDAVKIVVTPLKKDKGHKRRSPEEARALAAKSHAYRENVLTSSGYAPEATIAILRYLQSKGDKSVTYRDQDDCVRTFRNIAERFLYTIPTFNFTISSQIVLTFISVVDKLYAQREAIKAMNDVESTEYVINLLSSIWPKKLDENLKVLDCVLYSINKKNTVGFVRRARIFFECAIDVSMNMIDPFEGMFHEKPVQMPKEMKERIEAARQAKAPKADCPKCGQRMMYHFKLQKHFCANKECEAYSPPPKPKFNKKPAPAPDKPERITRSAGPRKDGFHYKGKKDNLNASEKFNAKFGKFDAKGKPAKAAPVKEEPALVKDKSTGKMRSFTAGSFDALDALKLG